MGRNPIPSVRAVGVSLLRRLQGGLAWTCLLWACGLGRGPDPIFDVTHSILRTGLSGLHPPATAPQHSYMPGHHSWLLKPRSPAMPSDNSLRKDAVGGVLALPSLDLGVAALLCFAAIFWSWDGLKHSSQFTPCANPHSSSSQVLLCLCLDLGLWPALKSAGPGCSHKSIRMALRTRVLGKGVRSRGMTNEIGKIRTSLASSSQEEPNPGWSWRDGLLNKTCTRCRWFLPDLYIPGYFRAVSGHGATWG